MNIYKALNEITKYIDDNLEEKIDYEVLSRMMGVNTYTMQRIFSLIASIPLSEYIRKRRLSNAGYDLYNTETKVMEVALKYQYNNATSFSRAFESFHGIKPSMVNKETVLKNYPKIIFKEDIKTTNTIEYKIVELKQIELYGVGISVNNDTIGKKAPIFFKETEKKYEKLYGKAKYGMVEYETTRDNCCKYYILYDKEIKDFEKVTIPASKWLLFTINSREAKDIQEMSHKFYLEFLPSCKYNLKKIPELEYYHDNVTDFLVPIY